MAKVSLIKADLTESMLQLSTISVAKMSQPKRHETTSNDYSEQRALRV